MLFCLPNTAPRPRRPIRGPSQSGSLEKEDFQNNVNEKSDFVPNQRFPLRRMAQPGWSAGRRRTCTGRSPKEPSSGLILKKALILIK